MFMSALKSRCQYSEPHGYEICTYFVIFVSLKKLIFHLMRNFNFIINTIKLNQNKYSCTIKRL